jgi:putative selenate reductase
MTDRFHPISMEQLTDWVFTELETEGSIFNVPRSAFFAPRADHRFRRVERGVALETPYGVAAGPHTQMAQNIVAAWLVGARVIELKTIQTLDELNVDKPCIDVEDEGYNVEWSQELRVHESFDEYLRAWVLVHALHRRLGWPGERPGVAFDMSVGYDLAGIGRPNVQWYLDAMADASAHLPAYVEIVARRCPEVREVDIPARISSSVTLSTMHGCPPDEIERISRYLIDERGLHTSVKCNPTLLGAERVRSIVNDDLGFSEVSIPDEAFGHDLTYPDAIPMFRRLRQAADERGVIFGLKLSNTLEVENRRHVFAGAPTMYMSGRALHAVTVNLAATIVDELGGDVPISFAGGADCFSTPTLIAGGMRTVTVCSDLLKSGGYLRMVQYGERLDAAFDAAGATGIGDLVRRTAVGRGYAGDPADTAACARHTLHAYAAEVREDRRYRKSTYRTDRTKTARPLGHFDCIAAPCTDECPVDQAVPRYMAAVRAGDLDEAVRVTRRDDPLPAILGRVCDHLCEGTCVRTHLDEPLAIRHIKRFVMDRERPAASAGTDGADASHRPETAVRVAIVGAGPAGLSAAEWLARAGVAVTMFEEHPYPGGMVGGAIPEYRLPQVRIDQDLAAIERLGVEIRYGRRAGRDFTVGDLRAGGYDAVLIALGAQRGRRLGLPDGDAAGVVDGVAFLRGVREGRPIDVGARVGVVGAGDTAMDCARTARRLGAASVSIVYRRTVDQMPADREEIHAVRDEGIGIVELARPVGVRVEDGRLAALRCIRTEYRGERDASGRKVPVDVPGSEFEVPLDTLVLAISQDPVLDAFGDDAPRLTRAGFVDVDPVTLETSIPGVYAGGDVAADGPASIVRAAADGKRAALAIAVAAGIVRDAPVPEHEPPDVHELVVRRARREYRVPIRTAEPEGRAGFGETVLGYTADEAAAEASRCLDCDRMCSLCVGVCPNMALLTYRSEPVRVDLPDLVVAGGAVVRDGSRPFVAGQRLQVAVLADLCNECGTCVTACPTSGAPYRDKPRLYLDRADFEAEAANAFLLTGTDAMEARIDGTTHRLSFRAGDAGARPGGLLTYEAPGFRTILEPGTFAVVEAELTGASDGERLTLEPAAIMATILAGIAGSLPHLPVAAPDGTRVPDPRVGG